MEQQVMETPRTETESQSTSQPPLATQPPKKRHGYLLVLVLGIVFAIAAVLGITSRLSESHALAKETEFLAVPTVVVIHPKAEAPQQEMILPSTLQAFTESPIYARTNGYLARWYKDIGSKVSKGQLLADIETPEIDQELMQAHAARDLAAAQLNLAKSSAQRWETLRKMDAVAQQETDERASGYIQQQAALANADANLRRLQQLESFKHIYAPFSGIITKRNTDIGALINAGNSGMNQELFDIAQIDPIRVYVDVPENYAPAVHPGVHASIELASMPEQKFIGNVVRSAESIDPVSRTLRTEIDVPNASAKLLPGSYAQAHFSLNVVFSRISVPVNALLFRAEGPRAAIVGPDNKVQLKPVVIGRDYGTEVEILDGLTLSDSIVLNPSDSLEDGQPVQVGKPAGGQS
jgi:multidrug efflux system membrane fusion protein